MLGFDVFVWYCCLVLLFFGFVVFKSGFGVLRVREIIGEQGEGENREGKNKTRVSKTRVPQGLKRKWNLSV